MPEELVLLLESLEISTVTVTVTQIKYWTDHDPVLEKVQKFVHQGWLDQLTQNSNLSIQEDWNLASKTTVCFGEVVLLSLAQEEKRF